MTLPQHQTTPINLPISGSGPRTSEAPSQAYVRRLHESRNAQNADDEPVRGIDPWQGIGL